jgi:hypothetical protein
MSKTELASKVGNITAMVQIGSVGGALIAFIACDKLGMLFYNIRNEEHILMLSRTHLGDPTTLFDLDSWSYHLHHFSRQLWPGSRRTICHGIRNWTDHCCSTSILGRGCTTKYPGVVYLHFQWLGLPRYHARILCKLSHGEEGHKWLTLTRRTGALRFIFPTTLPDNGSTPLFFT